MALVAYGSSDSENDFEEDSSELAPIKFTVQNQTKIVPETTSDANSIKFNLPTPKVLGSSSGSNAALEEDDEFLRKKPIAIEKPPPPQKTKPLPKATGGTIKIVLPALSSFSEHKSKDKLIIGAELPSTKTAGLLAMLPQPKSMATFGKATAGGSKISVLVPDSISRPKTGFPVSRKAIVPKPQAGSRTAANQSKSDSENSNDEDDFFSLNTEDNLPEVSAAEINAMVANKSSQMKQAVKKRQQQFQSMDPSEDAAGDEPSSSAGPSYQAPTPINEDAMEALCGSRSKRSRNQEPMNIIDISGDQVMPDRDEWLRNQLTATTEYQPRGLVDEEPGAGTKRKHQITYLAHQAKANEAELQAMWAANRHTKRQTQNKYGF